MNQSGAALDLSTVPTPEMAIRKIQIICLTLCAGLVILFVTVTFLQIKQIPDPEMPQPVGLLDVPKVILGGVFGALCIVASFFVPEKVTAANVKKVRELSEKWVTQQYFIFKMIAYTLSNVAGVMNLMLCVNSGSLVNYIFAVIALFAILLRFPTRDNYEQFRQRMEQLHMDPVQNTI